MSRNITLAAVALIAGMNVLMGGVTGKIAGTVTDSETGEPLVGANVIVEETDFGAATDLNGYFVILNVPPGEYTVRASMIGFADYAIQDVRVEIDLTTTLDFAMSSEVLAGQEVLVTAERRMIKQDVAASQKSITSSRIGELPFVGITEVLGLEAGITSDLGIRGSGRDQALFMVDGVVLRDERDNNPITQIPLSAVSEISVQTGGFGAEYHNVRSGVVNVVTKEGHPEYYSGTISVKRSPPGPKHFGISPYDRNAFWLRPYLDDDVAWTGTTNGAWDLYEQRQYPSFEGWNAVSERTLQDDDPTNDLSPAAAQRLFRWQHRKEGDIREPDYNIDAGFGGPVPVLGKSLGNLRFYMSTRAVKEMYLIPTNRDALRDDTWMIKLSSDLSSSTKLTLVGLYGKTLATSFTGFGREPGGTSYFRYDWEIASTVDRIGHTLSWRLYTNDYWARTTIFTNIFSARLTRILNPRTYYEVFVERVEKNYRTGPGRPRSREVTELFPGYFMDEAPFGYEKFPVFAIGDGMGMGGSVSTSRDTSRFTTWKAKFNLFSQINQQHQLSSGFEFVYDRFDLSFGAINWALPEGNTWTEFSRSPLRATLFAQDKLETKGFIGILGLNLEYIDPNGEWYVVEPYDTDFLSSAYSPDMESQFPTERVKPHYYLSPRLGISHPISVNSKLYFNYGHYRQMPNSDRLYRIQRGSGYVLDRLGDPTLPLARTISYELGYDQAIADRYLLHIAAYYKDISDQQDWTRFINIKGNVNYLKLTNNSYEDIRGLEIDVSKNIGKWVTGNLNYEYRVNTWGEFGLPVYYENPAEQRDYLRRNPPTQGKPLPRPRFKSTLTFHTPPSFGPAILGQNPLGGWLINLIGRWTSGGWFTWNPFQVKGLTQNVQWRPYTNVDLKASKTFQFGSVSASFFLDVYNIFNIKNFSGESFYDGFDFDYYMFSLHLDQDVIDRMSRGATRYPGIPGHDRPGDYRQAGVKFVPIEWIPSADNLPDGKPADREMYYYVADTGQYMDFVDGEWVVADGSRIDEILKTKAYIDMPNQTYFTFLNPRAVFFGIRFNFNVR